MNKSGTSSKKIALHDDWTNHPFVEWLSANKNNIIWAFLSIFAILIIISRFMAVKTANAEKDYFQSQSLFDQFESKVFSSNDRSEATVELEKLNELMSIYPELKPKFEGSLAQDLLIIGEVPQAQSYATDIFKRTATEHLQDYQHFSQSTFLIEQGLFEEALKESKNLQAKLDGLANTNYSLLYVMNLIRIATLHQQLGQDEEELRAWRQFQNLPTELESVKIANQIFTIGKASLGDYIKDRTKVRNLNHKEAT